MPCYINPSPIFRPQVMHITAISQASPAVITTEIDHNYVTGLVIRFRLYTPNGMDQINEKIVPITVTASNTFSVPIDSSSFDAYINDPNEQCGQVVPIGEINSILTEAVRNILTR